MRRLLRLFFSVPFIFQSAELDLNGDGVTDEIHFNITVPLNSGEVINRLSMLLFFQVRLQVLSLHLSFSCFTSRSDARQ